MDEKLLTLPWQIQVALASGYAAYMTAYVGIREHHKAVDTTFRALSFGLIATGLLYLLPADRPVVSILTTFSFTFAAGVWWRFFGGRWFDALARWKDMSWSDDTPSAWAKMQANSDYYVTQITAELGDGTFLYCTDTSKFVGAPFGPCILGANGDLLIYVDKSEAPGKAAVPVEKVQDTWGDLITYVPATNIKSIMIRHRPKVSGPSTAAVASEAEPEGPPAV